MAHWYVAPAFFDPSMYEEFKKDMSNEFEMSDMGLVAYYLDIKVKKIDKGIFIIQEGYTKKFLKKLKMDDVNPVGILMECGSKLNKHENGDFGSNSLQKFGWKFTLLDMYKAEYSLCGRSHKPLHGSSNNNSL